MALSLACSSGSFSTRSLACRSGSFYSDYDNVRSPDRLDCDHVASLKCSVCIRFQEKIYSCRNFNPAFIEGLQNLRASSFKDHAVTDMHKRAMVLFHKSRSADVTDYAPIARALNTLDQETASRLKRKFEIAYPICKDFAKLCELEEKHGVDLGAGHKNNQACAIFADYIGQAQKEALAAQLGKADGSTDSANVEDELVHIPKMARCMSGISF